MISSDLLCRYGNARFTTLPLKPLFDQECGRYCRCSSLKNRAILIIPLRFPAVEMPSHLCGETIFKNNHISKSITWISNSQLY